MHANIKQKDPVMGFNNERLMLTRITCQAQESDQRKYYESQWVKSSFKADLKASYMDGNEKSRILCGSI